MSRESAAEASTSSTPTSGGTPKKKRIRNRRPSVLKYTCTDCGQRCYSMAQMIMHKRTHTNERPFQCEQCDKKFKQQGGLQRHVSTIHVAPDARPFKCEICHKTFRRKENLRYHHRAVHEPKKVIPKPAPPITHEDILRYYGVVDVVGDETDRSDKSDRFSEQNWGYDGCNDEDDGMDMLQSLGLSMPLKSEATTQTESTGASDSAVQTDKIFKIPEMPRYKHSIFGVSVAEQMESFTETQCAEAKFRIQQVLFEIGYGDVHPQL